MVKKTIWLIAATMLLWGVSPLWAEPIFRVVYMNKENAPRILGGGSSIDWTKPGITVELLKMLEKKVGVQFQFKRMPWKRCLYVLENGAADATFHASYKPSRAEYGVYPTRDGKLDPSRSIYKNSYVLYARKGSGVSWDGETLSNAQNPIGSQLAYAIADDLRNMGHTVQEEASVKTNLDKLLANRISAYADMETIVDNVLDKLGPRYQAIEKLQPPLKEKEYYLLISKAFASKYPQLTERIWDAIRDIQQTDAYREMLQKYQE